METVGSGRAAMRCRTRSKSAPNADDLETSARLDLGAEVADVIRTWRSGVVRVGSDGVVVLLHVGQERIAALGSCRLSGAAADLEHASMLTQAGELDEIVEHRLGIDGWRAVEELRRFLEGRAEPFTPFGMMPGKVEGPPKRAFRGNSISTNRQLGRVCHEEAPRGPDSNRESSPRKTKNPGCPGFSVDDAELEISTCRASGRFRPAGSRRRPTRRSGRCRSRLRRSRSPWADCRARPCRSGAPRRAWACRSAPSSN